MNALLFHLIIFLFFIIKSSSQPFSEMEKTILASKAKNIGYDLSNQYSDFFYDICTRYSYRKKDVTLDYRRKYFYFPNENEKKYTQFYFPERNNTNLCLKEFFSIKYLISNIGFLIIFPLLTIEFTLLLLSYMSKLNYIKDNTPSKKIEIEQRKKLKRNQGKRKFTNLVSEVTQNDIENFKNKNHQTKNEKGNSDIIDSTVEFKTENFQNTQNNEKKDNEFQEKKEDNNNETKKAINMEEDNYTFGMAARNDNINNIVIEEIVNSPKRKNNEKKKINNKINNEKKKINIEKEKTNNEAKKINNETISNIIYNSINKSDPDNKMLPNGAEIEQINPNIIQTFENLEYSREEYFYFRYLLARIQDKRTTNEIYLDLLEHCQVIYKFCVSPFNIYEGRMLQIIYYLLKIDLFLIFNCSFITNNTINNIYDNTNTIIADLGKSFKAAVYTYILGMMIYQFTNIKNSLMKRRYKLVNLRIVDQKINMGMYKLTLNICIEYFLHKLIVFSIIVVIINYFGFTICFTFCAIYQHTQLIAIKNTLLSIVISEIAPFILCWIPAYLRRNAIESKDANKYSFCTFVEFLFID